MKRHLLVALALASTLIAASASAQSAPFNNAGATMGHWHIAAKDVQADEKMFVAMGGKLYMPAPGQPVISFPGVFINLVLGDGKGEGPTAGSVVNHVGLYVDDVQKRTAEWKAKGVKVLPGNKLPDGTTRLDQAFVETPDGVRMEIQEDKMQTVPVRDGHVHFSLPESEIPKAAAWYARVFGSQVTMRNGAPVVDLPGVQLRFAKADKAQAPTKGRVLDHIGFDVKEHAAFVARLDRLGIKLDEPVRKGATGNTVTYITDPWGTRIEIVQRVALGQPVQTN